MSRRDFHEICKHFHKKIELKAKLKREVFSHFVCIKKQQQKIIVNFSSLKIRAIRFFFLPFCFRFSQQIIVE